MHTTSTYDLVVVGSGAAGLSAALSHAEATADRSPQPRIAPLSAKLDEHENVDVHFQTEAIRLTVDDDGAVNGIVVRGPDGRSTPRRSNAADAVLYGYTAGIFVNGDAERFFDDGKDTWDNTFELIG